MHSTTDMSAISWLLADASRLIRKLADRRLASVEYLAGDVSIADFAVLGWAWRHERHNVDLAQFPHFKRWFDAMMARPATKRGFDVDLKTPRA